jgi:hypothetical protein
VPASKLPPEAAERRALFWRRASAAILTFLTFYLLYHITKFQPFWPRDFAHERLIDFSILFTESEFIATHGRYRATTLPDPSSFFFPYTPPATVLFNLYAWLGPGIGFWLFWLAKGVAVIAILVCSLRLAGAAERAERWAIAVAGLLAADYFVHHDLRQQNINLIYVAIVAASLLPATPALVGGVLIGLSATIKLYSFVLLPWLLWRRRYAQFFWAGASLAAFWIAAPVLYYGFDTTVQLYRDWLDELQKSGTLAVYNAPAPWITLRHFLARTFGWPPFGDPTAAALLVLQGSWLALVGAYFLATRDAAADGPMRDGADAAVLMMLPLPFSTVLQPTHGVPMLLAFVLIAAAAADGRRSRALRLTLAGAIVAAIVLRRAIQEWSLRGGMTFATLCLCVIGLLALVRAQKRPMEPARAVA